MIVSVRWDLSVVLICIPPIISNDESSSHVLIDHLNVIFGEMFIQILCPFFNLAIWFFCQWVVVLPILGINPYQIYNSQIFSSTGCLFILSIVSFDVKSFKLDVVPFLYFCSYSLCFWWHIQTNLGIDSEVNITWYQELLLNLLDVVTACVFKKGSFLRFAHSLSLFTFMHWSPLQCSYLENPRDGGAWWAAVYRVTQSWTRLTWLSSSRGKRIRCKTWKIKIFHQSKQRKEKE